MKVYRLLEILTILLRRESVTAPLLAERLGVSERTIRRDVDDLCLAGVPVVTRQGTGGGISIAEGYKLDKRLLLPDELQSILAGLRGLDSVGAGGDIKPLLDKLNDLQGEKIPGAEMHIDLASHYRESLSAKIETLKKAIAERRIVAFDYYYEKGRTKRRVEPHFILFKWSSWYLFAYCLKREDFRLFKLNRLQQLRTEDLVYTPRDVPQEKLSFDDTFSDQIPMVVAFDASVEYILVEGFGPESYRPMPDGRLHFEWGYVNLAQTANWLLGFGSKAEVLEPPELRRAIAAEARKTLSLYESP